jgi:hypothetical protein
MKSRPEPIAALVRNQRALTACLTLLASVMPAWSHAQTPAVPAAAIPAVKVSAAKAAYKHGEVMIITVEIPAAGYLRLYGVDETGGTALLFPNKWHTDDRVKAGRLVLPGEKAEYDFLLTLADGQARTQERLHAVFSPHPFEDSGRIRFTEAVFEPLGKLSSEQRNLRGVKAKARTGVSTAEFPYIITR